MMTLSFLEETWGGLTWTPWYTFDEIMKDKHFIPTLPGVYRIKPKGQNKLMYIGQTGRNLRERVTDLIRNTVKEEMPFNDPHTAGPSLWSWRDAEGWEFECSVSTVDLTKNSREGLECFLLWSYRLETGQSTVCNHGRFHQDYEKSRGRKSGFRGGKLQDSVPRNPSWGESFPPLHVQGTPLSLNFMGFPWSNFIGANQLSDVPLQKGVYRIKGLKTNTLLYIGQSNQLNNRLRQHTRKNWGQEVNFSYCIIENAKDYHLKEIENDLIGAYYATENSVPTFQFKNLKEGRL
ncbi:GIY-YIG nuclease family protein [Domibacillus sp. DTU_2020_1001157_1_SI_ALB_TIR_016]|uniref:GIY-YIG nuclease family protein n=1 Tax=Domibacillus sp. DTU_2020_1001157_1_SI_ALB_TIR_016 TaxID=3077789 RepID=UPI0028E2C9BB|nr:GIY-YIG nuclease family protein [Domibacillus sp. DTU_2020_1001157_1_SI_ALB_TIR_016]WNS82189.1 GIY-YIG nuclease family protein [Domibacillus sp. DTU_2020_1001157_1_SI_ALB_TIR_016]